MYQLTNGSKVCSSPSAIGSMLMIWPWKLLAEVVGEAAAVRIVLVEHGGALATELVGEARDGEPVGRIARDDAKRPGRDAGEAGDVAVVATAARCLS